MEVRRDDCVGFAEDVPTAPQRCWHTQAGVWAVVGILAVVVLYKQLPSDSKTVCTLLAAAKANINPALRLTIELVDNTPAGDETVARPDGVRYRRAPHNPGLAEAYNLSIKTARLEGYEWLLTLDQDTDLPPQFLSVMLTAIQQYQSDEQVAALVPLIVDHGRAVSPFHFMGGFLPKVLPPNFCGLAPPFTSALNSASLLRVSALQKIGGYDPRFPLNNSDTSLFHRIGKAGMRVAVVNQLTVQHELAIMNRSERMSIERYQKLLADERAVWDLHMGFLGRVERMARLVGRVAKDSLRREHSSYRAATLAEIRYRLLTPKRKRVAAWKDKSIAVN